MAITITGTMIIDETSGKQNSAAGGSDTTGNDVKDGLGFQTTGVAAFDTLLNAVVVQNLTGVNVTVAVSNGTNNDLDGTPMLSGFGADVTDLAFTNATGGPLLGELALSAIGVPLLTVDGTQIYLYSYTGIDLGIDENNVVFGRKANADGTANATGDVVFAAYLQPTDASGNAQSSDLNAVGSKVWMVQYEEIEHPITTNPDDALSLYNLNVSVSNRSDFSLAGAPSGQNLFLMYGDGTPSPADAVIIVTGKNPINQSSDPSAITSGDTVNTGQGGGPTTLGTNSQQVVEGTGLYFTFAKGANPNYTVNVDHSATSVGFLDQNEADVEANIDFTSLYGTNGASFTVVQSSTGDKSTLQISASTTDFHPGTEFIDNLHANTLVEVNKVTITTQPTGHGKNAVPGETLVFDKTSIGTTPTTLSGITVTFGSDKTVVIQGLEANDLIAYNTNGLHNRALIDNIGSADTNFDAPFDIGGFRLVNSNTTPSPFSELTFHDDGPTADIVDGGGVVTIDETADNQDNDSDAAAVLALFDTEVLNKGTDLNPAEFAISTTPLATTALSSFGQDQVGGTKVLSLAIVGGDGTDSLLDTTDGKNIILFKEGDLIVGRYDVANGPVTGADPAAFAIALQQDGNVAVAQYVSLTHPTAGSTPAAHDDRIDLTGLVNMVVTVTDGDGDTSTDSVGIGDDINFDDDGPSADVADGGGSVTIDETASNQDDDSDAAAVSALFAAVANKGTDLNPTEFAISTTPLATTTLSGFGQDQENGTKVLSLAIVGGDGTDSLLDTTDGKNIKLFKEGDLIVGRYDVANGTVTGADPAAFAIALQQDGNVAVAQYVSLTHPIAGSTPAAHDDRVDLAGLINMVVTVTDGDGDTSTDSVGIGDDINFDDDGPSADVADGGGAVTIDETASNQDNDSDAAAVLALFDTEVANKGTDLNPTEFAISTTPLATTALSSFGQDQENGTKVLSLAIVGGDGTDSLLDTTDGKNIILFKEGDLIVGRYDVANGPVTGADPAAFAIALLQDGNVAVAQYVSLTHPIAGSTPAAHDDRVDLAGLINAVVTVTDGDGDTSTDSFGIGDDINFDDDGPSADVADGGGAVTIDETANNQDNDSDAAAVSALFAAVANKGTDLNPTEFAISTTPLATTTLSSFGQDQENGTKVLSLAIVGGDGTDSLLDTTDGKNIILFKEAGLIVGRYDVLNGPVTGADPAAFAIALLQDGNVAVAQYVSLTHPTAGSSAAAYDDQVDLAGLINAVVTVTDGDGDTSTDSVGIGDDINFDDDGPAVSANNTVLLDDDALTGGNAGGTGDDADSTNVTGTLGHDFGQDGAGTVAYLTSGAPTGFSYEADGTNLLVKQGTTTVLTLTMDAATGAYGVTQNNPILHVAGLTENNQAFTISYRVTDGDGDTADGTLGINVDDDTPVVTAKSSLVYANTSNGTSLTDVGGTGVFAYSIGADKHLTPYSSSNSDFLSVALTGVTVGANAITNKTVTWVSETDSQAVFNVGFTYVSNNPAQGATSNATGTLVFDKVADTYTLKLAQEIESFSILNTSTPGNPLQGYALNSATTVGSNPPVSVMTLASDFFVQFEGFGVNNGTPQTFAYDTGTGLFSNDRRYVTISSDSIGAASDTLQSDEVIDLDFYTSNPQGFTNSGAERATSKAIVIEFTQAGIGAGKDMLVVLKLVDDNDPTHTINRTFIVGNSAGNDDVINSSVPAYGFVAQAQNGIVVFESNDYNFDLGGGVFEHYSIQGAQVVTSTQGTSGTGYELNGVIDNPATPNVFEGATTNAQIAFGGATTEGNNEPIKIVNIGFVASTTPDAHLTFDVVLADADSDATATQTLDVTIVGDNRVTASTGADSFVIGDADVDGLLSMALTVIGGGFNTDFDTLNFTTAGSVANYTEVLAPVTNLAAFTAAADIALDGTKTYYFGVVGGDGYLAFDGDGNGITAIIQLVGVTNIDSTDIV